MLKLHVSSPTSKVENRLEVENLSHTYQTRRALDNVSFGVSCGEIFGLLGPNGSGKTTLFRILSTLIPVTSGAVRILGYDLTAEVKAIRKLLGVVFQHPGLDGKLTVTEKFTAPRASLRTLWENSASPNFGTP